MIIAQYCIGETFTTLAVMDPGTIIAVVELSAKLLSVIGKYYTEVKNARDEIFRLTHELETSKEVLQRLLNFLQGRNSQNT